MRPYLKIVFSVLGIVLAMAAVYFIGKSLPAAAVCGAGSLCMWVCAGRRKKSPKDEAEEPPAYPTDEEGNRLPDGDEQWLL